MISELNGDFLQWLRGFYYVAKTGSVRRAAELMHRNPSTISYQLRCLEDELGVALFDRHNKTMRITPEGETLQLWAISTFDTLQSLISSVGSVKGELQGNVRVSATLPIIALAVKTICDFTRKHPRVKLVLDRGLSGDVRKAVADSVADFGLMPVIEKPDRENLEVIAKARPLLVLHRDNPWHVPSIPEMADLERLPYVTFSDTSCQDDLGNYILASGMGAFMQTNAVLRLNNYHLILRFVWQKLGVTIMDEMCFQASNFGADWENLRALPLDHLFPNRLYGVLTRKGKRISPQAQALMEALRHFYQGLAADTDYAWQEARQIPEGAPGAPWRKEAP